MSDEIVWRGFPIARGVRWEGERGFCVTPTPMPVGTTLVVEVDGTPRTVHVAQSVEGDPAGMWLAHGPGPSAPAVIPPAPTAPAAAPTPPAAASPRDATAEPVSETSPARPGEPATLPGQPSRRKKRKR